LFYFFQYAYNQFSNNVTRISNIVLKTLSIPFFKLNIRFISTKIVKEMKIHSETINYIHTEFDRSTKLKMCDFWQRQQQKNHQMHL